MMNSGGVWTNGGIGAAVGVGFGAVGPVTVDDDTTPTQSLSDGFEAQAWQGNDVGKVGATKGYEGVEENSGGSKLRGDEEARKEAGRLKRRRKLSAKARESNVYKGSGGDGKEAGKGVPGGSDERHDRSSGAKRQVTRRSTSCPPDGNSSRQEEQNGNGQGKEEEEEESQEEPDFVRCESTCLDRAPWREQSMPRTKLRAYRDPNGRFRVMDFKGTLLKTMWLNQHKGYKVRGKEEGSRDRSGPSQSIKANVQKTEPKENYPKASATKSIVENSDGIIAVSPTASSKGKRKSEEPSPAKEAKEPKDGQISHVQLFEAMFARPRAPGKRAPKAQASRALALLESIPDASASDSDFSMQEISNGDDDGQSSSGESKNDGPDEDAEAESERHEVHSLVETDPKTVPTVDNPHKD